MTFETIVAGYGAVLSSLTAAWAIREKLRDTARLTVRLSVGHVHDATGKPTKLPPHALVTVVNAGTRPASVHHLGGDLESGSKEHWMSAYESDKKLQEGDRISIPLELAVLVDSKKVYIVDTTERQWFVSGKELKKARSDAAKLLAEGAGEKKVLART